MRYPRARIGLYPKLAGLFGFFDVPGDLLMEDSRDEILLRLTRSVAQFVCLSGVAGSDTGFSNRGRRDAQPGVGECKVWVEFDGTLIERNRGGFPCCKQDFPARTEGFESFQRRRSGLIKRGIKLLH